MHSLLDNLEWNSLEERRLHNQIQMLCQINKGLVDINLTSSCQLAHPRTRGTQRLHQEHISHSALLNSFFSCTMKDWNHLPVTTASAASLRSFLNQLFRQPSQPAASQSHETSSLCKVLSL